MDRILIIGCSCSGKSTLASRLGEKLEIPGRDWDHRLVWIEKIASTPEKYPRKAGKPEKKPL